MSVIAVGPVRLIRYSLVEHAEYGFTPKEIHAETGVARGSVSPTLTRLREQDLVRHRADRWAAASDDRLAAYHGMQASLDAVSERHSEDWYATNPDWD